MNRGLRGLIRTGLVAVLVLYGIFVCARVWGQDEDVGSAIMMERINVRLSEGDCAKAQRAYDMWKKLAERTDASVENRIKACRQKAENTEKTPVSSPATTATGIAAEILRGKKRDIQFGNYKWRVLDVQGDKALLITEDVIENRPYNNQDVDVTWETCDLRKYLNGEFLRKFTEEERREIAETQISNPDNLWYGKPGGMNTVDKIFLLSLEEVDRYFGDSGDYKNKRRKKYENNRWVAANNGYALSNAHDSDRVAKIGNKTCWWWLRSPGVSSYDAADVLGDGLVYVSGVGVGNDSGGVRPAFWLNLKS